MTGRLTLADLVAGAAAVLAAAGLAWADPPARGDVPNCAVQAALSVIDAALDRSTARVDQQKPLTIVAIGSSSTKGTGASAPAKSYPSRLEARLQDLSADVEVQVLNRGVGGQDVAEELARFDRDIFAVDPDLVIWQVGTNAVLRRDDLTNDERSIRRGVASIREHGSDLVLMDLQYAPRVLARPGWGEMERIIGEVARSTHVGLFRRFEIMQEWDHTQQFAPAAIIGPDGLHMTDASYGCLATQFADALAWNWWSHGKLAKAPSQNPAAVAGLGLHPDAPATGAW